MEPKERRIAYFSKGLGIRLAPRIEVTRVTFDRIKQRRGRPKPIWPPVTDR
jgi:hypothetical protein